MLLILGEAASRVRRAPPERHPDIPWEQIVALRNRLIHGYDVIDYDILWKIITSDLPPLIASLEAAVVPLGTRRVPSAAARAGTAQSGGRRP